MSMWCLKFPPKPKGFHIWREIIKKDIEIICFRECSLLRKWLANKGARKGFECPLILFLDNIFGLCHFMYWHACGSTLGNPFPAISSNMLKGIHCQTVTWQSFPSSVCPPPPRCAFISLYTPSWVFRPCHCRPLRFPGPLKRTACHTQGSTAHTSPTLQQCRHC